MEEKRDKLSPKFQHLMMQALDFIKQSPGASDEDINEKLSCPKPITSIIITFLQKLDLIREVEVGMFGEGYEATPNTSTLIAFNKISKIDFHPRYDIYKHFINLSCRMKYELPKNLSETTFRELTAEEYLYSKELYDYETITMFNGQGYTSDFFTYEFLLRQFSSVICKANPEKKVHVFVAENNGHILGLVSLSNYTSADALTHHLPCKKEQLYNVNFIATRKEVCGNGIASELLKRASKSLMEQEDVFAINYLPICSASKSVMKKVFREPSFYVYERDYGINDQQLLGDLSSFVIFPEEYSFIAKALKAAPEGEMDN